MRVATLAQTEQSIGNYEYSKTISDGQRAPAAAGEDIILSQESITIEIGGTNSKGKGTKVLDVLSMAGIHGHGRNLAEPSCIPQKVSLLVHVR